MVRKPFPRFNFTNISLPIDRIRLLKPETELYQVNDDSIDIFKSDLIEKYCRKTIDQNGSTSRDC